MIGLAGQPHSFAFLAAAGSSELAYTMERFRTSRVCNMEALP
jgi:hypothetical protein